MTRSNYKGAKEEEEEEEEDVINQTCGIRISGPPTDISMQADRSGSISPAQHVYLHKIIHNIEL
jgi:hypothetical protein